MNVRDRIQHNLNVTKKDIRFYESLGPEWADKVAELYAQRDRLLERAQHYDREQELGYEKPCSTRWRSDPVDGGFRSQTINLDEE